MVPWPLRRGRQLLLVKATNADWHDWYIFQVALALALTLKTYDEEDALIPKLTPDVIVLARIKKEVDRNQYFCSRIPIQ